MNRNEPVLGRIRNWLELIRFSHTVFALPFAILAAFLAYCTPIAGDETVFLTVRVSHLSGVLLCMVFARSAAMAFNRLVDHKIDAANPRTQSRHLPAGLLSRGGVATFTVLCGLGFIGSTLLFLPNRLPLYFSVPVLVFLLGYSLAKRFTSSAHLWLGIALSLSPICVWVAIRGGVVADLFVAGHVPILLSAAVACWVAGFDILYACQDADFDRDNQLHSIPSKYGIAGAMKIAAGFHAMMLVLLIGLAMSGAPSGLGAIFLVGVLMTSALVIYQHRLVKPDDLTRVNIAFFQTNALISLLLLVTGIIDTTT